MSKKIIIVDFKLGNLFSVLQACRAVGLNAEITSSSEEAADADALLLPGVGAFGEAMQNLDRLQLTDVIRLHHQQAKPLFGICLGMQLLFTESEEFGNHQGLGLLPGKIIRFPVDREEKNSAKVPQIGWNRIYAPDGKKWMNTPYETVQEGSYMYFVHSYYAVPQHPDPVLSATEYEGVSYCSSVATEQGLFATQFHPEKSGKKGLEIYRNWAVQHQLI